MKLRMDAVRERLEDRVPAITRYGNAADFASVVEHERLPLTTPIAYVLFGGMIGRTAEASAGMFIQNVGEAVTVILADRINGDALGEKALKDISPLLGAVIEAVCGWAPEDAIGVFELRSAELVGAKGGALIFQIEFTLNDQLRITP